MESAWMAERERIADQSDTERTHIRLCVSENAQGNDPEGSMSVGGLAYATVKDTIKGKNIIPPYCNCKIAADRSAEIARIMADPERRKHGVCIHLMQLNDEWRNLWKPGQSYLSKTNRAPVTLTDGSGEEVGEPETAEGITMTSMLFCRHGGIIMPVTSGQVIETVYDFEKIDKIVEPSGEVWQEETVYIARYVSRCMLDKEYPIEIIAGVVGNIVNEGRFGMFEFSLYKSRPKPKYLCHMDDCHAYATLASGKSLSDVGTGILEQLKGVGQCNSEDHSYGLGAVQWSEGRCDTLVEKYLDRFGGNAYPTMEECREKHQQNKLISLQKLSVMNMSHPERIPKMREKARPSSGIRL